MAKKLSSSRPMWPEGTNSGSWTRSFSRPPAGGGQADGAAADLVGVLDGAEHVGAVAAAADGDQHVVLDGEVLQRLDEHGFVAHVVGVGRHRAHVVGQADHLQSRGPLPRGPFDDVADHLRGDQGTAAVAAGVDGATGVAGLAEPLRWPWRSRRRRFPAAGGRGLPGSAVRSDCGSMIGLGGGLSLPWLGLSCHRAHASVTALREPHLQPRRQLLGACGAGGGQLLDGDRGHEVAHQGGLGQGGAGGQGQHRAGRGAVAGPGRDRSGPRPARRAPSVSSGSLTTMPAAPRVAQIGAPISLRAAGRPPRRARSSSTSWRRASGSACPRPRTGWA